MLGFASCKRLVVLSVTIVLRFILRLLGLTSKKPASVNDHNTINMQTEHKVDLLKERNRKSFRTSSRSEQNGRREGNKSSGDASGESADEESFVIPRKPYPPRNRRCPRHGMSMTPFSGLPMTSSPLYGCNRQYTSSSGFSTGSDLMSEMNSFADHSLGVNITRESLTELENVKLKSALDSLIKEKVELQEKVKKQHELLSSKIDLQNVKLDTNSKSKYIFKSTYSGLNSLDSRNISMAECQKSYSFFKVCKHHKQLNNAKDYPDETCLCCQSPTRRVSPALLTDVAHASMADLLDNDNIEEKMMTLKNDNDRLKQYINGLLFMILENSPSLLESKQHTHKMYTFSEL